MADLKTLRLLLILDPFGAPQFYLKQLAIAIIKLCITVLSIPPILYFIKREDRRLGVLFLSLYLGVILGWWLYDLIKYL